MPHPADIVLDANYRGPFAADAEYFAPGERLVAGQGLPCRVMRGGKQAGLDVGSFNVRPSVDTDTIRVRVSQIRLPARSGVFYLIEENAWYRMMAEPESLDRHRREWTCESLLIQPAAIIVFSPAFARSFAGGLRRAVALASSAIAKGLSGTLVRSRSIAAPAVSRGSAGGLQRSVLLVAPARSVGFASGALVGVTTSTVNAPGRARGWAGTLTRAGYLEAEAGAEGRAGSLQRGGELSAAAVSVSRAASLLRQTNLNAPARAISSAPDALEQRTTTTLNAPGRARGRAGTLQRQSHIEAGAISAGQVGTVTRSTFLNSAAHGLSRAGSPLRDVMLIAPASSVGRAEGGLEGRGHYEINATATARGYAGGLVRSAELAAEARGSGHAESALQRLAYLVGPDPVRAIAGGLWRRADILAPGASIGSAGTLVGSSGGPVFDRFTLHAWDPESGAGAQGAVMDAVGQIPLWAVSAGEAVPQWAGGLNASHNYLIDAEDVATILTGNRTISFWMRVETALQGHAYVMTWGQADPSSGGIEGGIRIGLSDPNPGLVLHTSGGWGWGEIATSPMPEGEWFLMTVTLGGPPNACLYINDAPIIAEAWLTVPLVDQARALVFGGRSDASWIAETAADVLQPSNFPLTARLGDVRIHNKILSGAEISALHAAGRQSY